MPKPQQISLSLKDSTALIITLFQSKKDNAPTLVIYPAFGVKATYYNIFAEKLTDKGIHVVTVDLRGHGLSAVPPDSSNNYGFLEMINDLQAVSEYLKQRNPRAKKYILGHSLGGQTASLAVAKYPDSYDGLIMIGSPNVYYKGWSGLPYYRRKMLVTLLPVLSWIVDFLPKFKMGGHYATKTQITEWGHTGKTGDFIVLGDNLDYEKAFKKVSIPVFAIDIEGDLMAPQKAIRNLYQKFESTKALSTLTLTKAMTSSKITHINWPRTADEVMVTIIEEWLDGLK